MVSIVFEESEPVYLGSVGALTNISFTFLFGAQNSHHKTVRLKTGVYLFVYPSTLFSSIGKQPPAVQNEALGGHGDETLRFNWHGDRA
jgi:hypothetical protein